MYQTRNECTVYKDEHVVGLKSYQKVWDDILYCPSHRPVGVYLGKKNEQGFQQAIFFCRYCLGCAFYVVKDGDKIAIAAEVLQDDEVGKWN